MRTEFSIKSILGRVSITIIALSIIYIFFGPPSYVEAEMINEIFFLFIVPPILITGTILLSFLIGTPIRIIPKWSNWWYKRPYIAIILLLVGITLCCISGQPQFQQSHVSNSEGEIVKASNFQILSAGWFITSFSLTHFYFDAFCQFVKRKSQLN